MKDQSFAFFMTVLLLVISAGLALLQAFRSNPVNQSVFLPPTGRDPDISARPTSIPQMMRAEMDAVETAIETAISGDQHEPLLFMYETEIDQLQVSPDAEWSTAWMVPRDPDTGEVIPAEPGLVILRKIEGEWQPYLPSDPNWYDLLQQVPDSVLSPEAKAEWMEMYSAETMEMARAAAAAPLSGYVLPWSGGQSRVLTQSVGHDRYDSSLKAHYAFDFSTSPSNLWDIYAARSGTVWRARWICANGSESCSNYLVLEDQTTTPTTYQLYLHLAQDSIPPELRTPGAPVTQGQFIGVADDTGVSTGHHLHFHVHTTPTSYWGQSVDIVFSDVAINGGRPRIPADRSSCRDDSRFQDVCDTFQSSYISGNVPHEDITPATGGILEPLSGQSVITHTLHLEGWATDIGTGLQSAQFKAFYNDAWRPIGQSFSTGRFEYDWDVCAAGVPEGPLSLALDLRDKNNNVTRGLPGLTQVGLTLACPAAPPACVPGASQVALFAETGFRGDCKTFNVGNYTSQSSFGALGWDNAESIQVGRSVMVTLFDENDLSGRAETFFTNDSSLMDNRIGSNRVSSIKVLNRTKPSVPRLATPGQQTVFTEQDSILLSWQDSGGGVQFQARLLKEGLEVQSYGPSGENFWSLGSLEAGSYSWQVKSSNPNGESAWSSLRSFQVTPSQPPQTAPLAVPYEDAMEGNENGWEGGSTWKRLTQENHTPGGSASWFYRPSADNYNTFSANQGHLTSPPIAIPPDSSYFLRFWYQYETEGPGRYWDQRRVQISQDGGPFTDLLLLSDDPSNTWLQSPALSLALYAGHTIQIRFLFASLDDLSNAFKGWGIDDVRITEEPPENCADGSNLPSEAEWISFGATVRSEICPGGDMDYYRFSGKAGQKIAALVEAQYLDSALDPSLALLDTDGTSVLAFQDDLVLTEKYDASVQWVLPASGDYTLRVSAWDHPMGGGSQYTYRLRLWQDNKPPQIAFDHLTSGSRLPSGAFNLTVNASDAQSGIRNVRFLIHPSDWQSAIWQPLGEDWDGRDGWNLTFNPNGTGFSSGMALYAIAYDWAGNSMGAGVWNLNKPGLFLPFIRK